MKRPAAEGGAASKKAAPGPQPKLKLLYFDIAGKGEPLRLAMHHAGLEFEDIRLTREEFMTKKTSGELRFGQVPALIVQDGSGVPVTLVQTGAIARYIGKLAPQSELYPDDAIKAAQVDALVDQASDMMCAVMCAKYQDRFGFDGALGGPEGEGTKKVEAALRSEVMPRHFAFFESVLTASASGWIAATDAPSIADFVLGAQFKQLEESTMVDGKALLQTHPKVRAFVEKFHAEASVRDWYAARQPAA